MIYKILGYWSPIIRAHLITFVSPGYEKMIAAQSRSLAKCGMSGFYVYDFHDLQAEFVGKNIDTLNFERGAGYWIWKPYIILEHLEKIPIGDILIYVDAGVLPERDFFDLLDESEFPQVHLWIVEGANFLDWTEPSVLNALGVDPFRISPFGVMAGGIALVNNELTKETISKWQGLCEQPEFLRPETLGGYQKSKGFYWHRHDQSLLNILVTLHPERFKLHGGEVDQYRLKDFFNVHRNLNIRSLSIVATFPRFREWRSYLVSRLPNKLKWLIRSHRALKSGKLGTKLEFEEIRKSFEN